MKKALWVFILLMFASLAQASESSHRAAAVKLLEVTKAERNLDILYATIESSIERQFKEVNVPDDAVPILMKYQKKQLEVVKSELSWQKIKDDLASAYMVVYSEDEMVQITRFYQTPVGRKFVDKMPELAQRTVTLAQSHIPAVMEKSQKLGEELARELDAYDKAKAEKAKPQAPAPGQKEGEPKTTPL